MESLGARYMHPCIYSGLCVQLDAFLRFTFNYSCSWLIVLFKWFDTSIDWFVFNIYILFLFGVLDKCFCEFGSLSDLDVEHLERRRQAVPDQPIYLPEFPSSSIFTFTFIFLMLINLSFSGWNFTFHFFFFFTFTFSSLFTFIFVAGSSWSANLSQTGILLF